MKNPACLFLIIVVSIITAAFSPAAPEWRIGEGYSIKFSGSSAKGSFSGLTGLIKFDRSDLAGSKMDVSVAVNTIETGNTTKNGHAKGENWLNEAGFPTIHFACTSFQPSGDRFIANGTVTIKGVSRNVSIPFSFSQTGDHGVFDGSFSIRRKDFDIKGTTMGFMVGNEITVTLHVPVIKK